MRKRQYKNLTQSQELSSKKKKRETALPLTKKIIRPLEDKGPWVDIKDRKEKNKGRATL